MLYLPCDYSS